MAMLDQVSKDIAEAMRARDPARLGALRMLKAALVNRRVETGRELAEPEAQQVVATLVKQRKDSIEHFARAGRPELVEKETAELQILQTYLPPAADAAEIERVVDTAIHEANATSVKDLGRVMKIVMSKLAGQSVDGKAVNQLVRRKLGG